MMKKNKILLTTTALLSTLTVLATVPAPMVLAAEPTATTASSITLRNDITVTVDGSAVVFDSTPAVQNQRVLVPLRKVCEALGARVEWDQATKTIFMQKRDRYISMKLGENKITINGEDQTIDVPSLAESNRTLVPIRAIAQAMDADVQWDQAKQMVVITSKQGDHHIQDQWHTYTVVDEPTKKTLYTEHTVYPILSNDKNDSAIANINSVCKKAVDDIIDTNEKELIDAARDFLKDGTDLQTALDMEMTIPYDQKDRLSVRYNVSLDLGGAHPSHELQTYNFDAKTGKLLTLQDVLGGTEAEALQAVRDAYAKDIAANPDNYFEEAATTVKTMSTGDFVWSLSDKGVVVEAQSYALAPYAAGNPSVTIAYPAK
jgi:hypothetical protein